MLQTVEEIQKVRMPINGIDDANLLSVDSTEVMEMTADGVKSTERGAEELEEIAEATEVENSVAVEEETEETSAEPEVSVAPKAKDPVQKRIDELTKKRREAERQVEFEKAKRLELEAELQKVKSSAPATDKPKIEDFDTEAEFVEALTEWKVEQKLRASDERRTKEVKETEEKQVVAEQYEEIDGMMEKGREKYEDFDTLVLDEKLSISAAMMEAVLFAEKAEDILYYLAKNPGVSEKISKLPPLRLAHELGKLEAELSRPKPVPLKKTTKSPEPITPVKSTGIVERDPSKMTPREYRLWRESNS